MANTDFVAARWQEILDGKTAWDIRDLPERDEDKFHVEYVLPLRQLRDDGKIERIAEGNEIGSRGSTRVFITGGINYTD
jgi:hypothetical protein